MYKYDEFMNQYLLGNVEVIYLYGCLDFAYYCNQMRNLSPFADVQIIWQHSYDLIAYAAGKNYAPAQKLKSAMDLMLEEKSQESLTAACNLVFSSISHSIKVSEFAAFSISPELRQKQIDFENSIGILNDKYYLLRATILKKKKKPLFKRFSLMMLLVFILMVLALLFVAK